LDAAAVVAEEAVERKEARRVRPWLSELDVPEWQELAGDRLGWRKMLKSIKIRALVLQVGQKMDRAQDATLIGNTQAQV
jgi:hypothetical protein